MKFIDIDKLIKKKTSHHSDGDNANFKFRKLVITHDAYYCLLQKLWRETSMYYMDAIYQYKSINSYMRFTERF